MATPAARLDAEDQPSAPLPPGPREPRLVQALRYAVGPYAANERAIRLFGDCVTVRSFGPPMVMFNHPEAARDVFADELGALRAGEANADVLGPILGRSSLLLLDGERHLRERRLMGPPLHGERMHVYGRLMQEIADRVIAAWPIGRPFPIHKEMQTITLDVILRAVFGLDEASTFARVRAPIVRFLKLADSAAAPFLAIRQLQFELGGLAPWGRFVRDRDEVRRLLLAEIARRRTDGTAGRTDILSMLVDARDDHGESMRNEELLDELFTLLMAGHETTATSLAWVFWHLLRHPDVVTKLRDELRAVAGDGRLAPEQVGRLEYLDAVIKESARLTPVATGVLRRLRRPARIGGRDLPAGINVGVSIYAIHHRADLWPEPERFDPDRFVGARPAPYTYFPFGGGVRRCIGAAFATYEMKVVLAEVLPRVALRVAPGYRMRPVLRTITVAPSRGMPVVVERRLSGAEG
jgi:cytochrome P450 family 110